MKKGLTTFAKELRRRATDAERLLWSRLRAGQMEGIKFRRQQPIEGFIVDFVSLEKRLIIEVDGGQHAQSDANDAERDQILRSYGFEVLRFWNNEVLDNIDRVIDRIRAECLVLAH